jgi:phage-related protein
MRNGAADAASAVSSQIGRIPGIISGIGGQAAGVAYGVGAAISEGMAAGMRSALGAIEAAAARMVAAAETAVRARAETHSPSLLFARIGTNIGEGFELGIRSMIPDVTRASAALVNTPILPGNGAYAPAYAYSGHSGTGGGTTIVHQDNRQIFAVKSEEWLHLVEQAENAPARAHRELKEAINDVFGAPMN